MAQHLKRYQDSGNLHFITFRCYDRKPYLGNPRAAEVFEHSLELTRRKYGFRITGYVVMPEHVHLLVTEPKTNSLATSLQALKISVAMRLPQKPFWLRRYHDFNIFSHEKRVEIEVHPSQSS